MIVVQRLMMSPSMVQVNNLYNFVIPYNSDTLTSFRV